MEVELLKEEVIVLCAVSVGVVGVVAVDKCFCIMSSSHFFLRISEYFLI